MIIINGPWFTPNPNTETKRYRLSCGGCHPWKIRFMPLIAARANPRTMKLSMAPSSPALKQYQIVQPRGSVPAALTSRQFLLQPQNLTVAPKRPKKHACTSAKNSLPMDYCLATNAPCWRRPFPLLTNCRTRLRQT